MFKDYYKICTFKSDKFSDQVYSTEWLQEWREIYHKIEKQCICSKLHNYPGGKPLLN